MKKIYPLLIHTFLVFTFLNLEAQSWEIAIPPGNPPMGLGAGSEGFDVQPTSDGGFIVVGEVDWPTGAIRHYIQLTKTDATGNIEWSHVYHEGNVLYEEGRSVLQTSDGGYLIGGTSAYGSGSTSQDLFLMKTDELGDTVWTQSFMIPGIQQGRSLIATSDGGYLLAGFANPGFIMVKTDASGNMQWEKTYLSHAMGMEGAEAVIQTNDEGYMLTGTFHAQTFLFKTDVNGDSLWMETYINSKYEGGTSLQQTADNGFAVGTFLTGFAGMNPSVLKTDANGTQEFSEFFSANGTTFWGIVRDIELTNNGFAVTGFTNGPPPGNPFGNGYIVRLNSSGEEQWHALISDTLSAVGNALEVLQNNCYVITGRSDYGAFLANVCEADHPTATEEVDYSHNIQIFPNPTSGKVSVILENRNNSGDLQFNLFDMLGHKVMSAKLPSNNNEVDLTDCPGGPYSFQISRKGKIIKQEKLIVLH